MTPNSDGGKRRVRRNERPAEPRPMRETERDHQIVRLVYEYRMLSQTQIQRILGKSSSTVQQWLIRLYHHRYLERVFLPIAKFGSSPTLYILDKRGIELLQRLGVSEFNGQPSKRPSGLFIEHTLALSEFRIAVARACEPKGWQVSQWRSENQIKADYDYVRTQTPSGQVQSVPIVPDSFFVIDVPEQGSKAFFVELDRGTMTIDRFVTKVSGYVAYYKTGGFAKRFGTQGFRVLTVVDTPGPERMHHLVTATGKVDGIGRRFWFTQLGRVNTESVLEAPIWIVAENNPHFEGVSLFSF